MIRRTMAIACALSVALVAAGAAPLRLSQAVDFLDNCYFTHDPAGYYTPAELRRDVQAAYDSGFRKIYFRGTGGVAYHESKVRPVFAGDYRLEMSEKLVKTIHAYDVVAEYLKVCHELGMELYYWIPIFDNGGAFARNYPGMADYAKWGANSVADPALKPEFLTAHRFADRPRERPNRPIAKIRMKIGGPAIPEKITDKDLLLFTGDYDQPLTRYAKPFSVTLEPAAHGKILTLTGLAIDAPVIKFASDVFTVSTDTRSADDLRAYYADGEELTMYRTLEGTPWGDRDREHIQYGCGGMGFNWGKSGNTFIARFGDFERHAFGVPEYAYPECRQRLVNIVKEVYERYPEMDGVTFSIRTHSLPNCGFVEELGYGRFFYGFSEPVMREYKKRYGVDPRTSPYDETKLLRLRGEYVTQMLDEVGEVVHRRGGKLEMMAPVRTAVYADGRHVNSSLGSMFPWWTHAGIDDFFDVGTWAKRGSVDLVLMVGTQYRQTAWTPAWRDEVARFRAKLDGTRTRLGLHYLVNDAQRAEMEACLPGMFADENLDEVEFYEQWHMGVRPHMYEVTETALKALSRPVARAREKARPDVFVTVDFLDECGMARYQPALTAAHIRDLAHRHRAAGAAGLVWRVASLGVAGYRTPNLTQIEEADDVDQSEMLKRNNGFIKKPRWPEHYVKTWSRTLQAIEQPYREVRRACDAEGLKLYLWVDLFDEMLGKFLSTHPECLVHTPAGGRFPGLRDYANPVAVREKLDEIAELYPFRPDGLYLSSSCHARHLNYAEPDGAFGTLKAETFTGFLRRLKAECAPHGIKLMVMAPFGGYLNFNSPYFSKQVKYRIETDWKTWVDEGLADSLVLADYNLLWRQDGIWASKGLTDARPGHYALDVFAPEFLACNRGRAKLYLFNGLEFSSRAESIGRAAYEVRKFGLDGQVVHESMLIENDPGSAIAIRSAAR